MTLYQPITKKHETIDVRPPPTVCIPDLSGRGTFATSVVTAGSLADGVTTTKLLLTASAAAIASGTILSNVSVLALTAAKAGGQAILYVLPLAGVAPVITSTAIVVNDAKILWQSNFHLNASTASAPYNVTDKREVSLSFATGDAIFYKINVADGGAGTWDFIGGLAVELASNLSMADQQPLVQLRKALKRIVRKYGSDEAFRKVIDVTSYCCAVHGQDNIAMTSGEASNPGPPKKGAQQKKKQGKAKQKFAMVAAPVAALPREQYLLGRFKAKTYASELRAYALQLINPHGQDAVPAPIYNGVPPTLYQLKYTQTIIPMSVTYPTNANYRIALPLGSVANTSSTFAGFSVADNGFVPGEFGIDIYPSVNSPVWVCDEATRIANVVGVDTTAGTFNFGQGLDPTAKLVYQYPTLKDIYSSSSESMIIALTAELICEGDMTHVSGNTLSVVNPKAGKLSYIPIIATNATISCPSQCGVISKGPQAPINSLGFMGCSFNSEGVGCNVNTNGADTGYFWGVDRGQLLDMPMAQNAPAVQRSKLIWAPTEANSLKYKHAVLAGSPGMDSSLSYLVTGAAGTGGIFRLTVRAVAQVVRVIPGAAFCTGSSMSFAGESKMAFDHASQLVSAAQRAVASSEPGDSGILSKIAGMVPDVLRIATGAAGPAMDILSMIPGVGSLLGGVKTGVNLLRLLPR